MNYPILNFIQIIVHSQEEVHVQPRNAEACDYPAGIAHDCQVACDYLKKPIVLLGARGDRHTFMPSNRKGGAK